MNMSLLMFFQLGNLVVIVNVAYWKFNVADNCPLGFQTLPNQQAFSLGFPKFDSLQSLFNAKSINLSQFVNQTIINTNPVL